jgi:N-acetyl-1-D-myo-inositol-2-amino-2-deoxy-alpha-D-glucopyranoside deacetylase
VVTTAIDGTAYAAAKAAAMRAHTTQIEVAEPWFALSNALAQPLFTTEYYELVRGERAGPGRETDLFAGIEQGSGIERGSTGTGQGSTGTEQGKADA